MEPLIVSGTLDSIGAIAEYVLAAAGAAGLDKKTAYNLRLAVDEIATNIITYGYFEADKEGVLAIHAHLDQQSLTISIEDTGAPFDATQQSAPDDLDKPLEQRQSGGLGIYLAGRGVDKFSYERVGDRNRNIFVVNRHPS